MEDVIKLKRTGNFCLLLGPGLQTQTFLRIKVVKTGNNETDPQKSISLKESSQSKAATHMRNLKYKGEYPNYERPNNRNMCLRERKPLYTLLNVHNLTTGNQIFKLSYHLLYYFMNLYSHVLIILNPPLPPLNGNRKWMRIPLDKPQEWKTPEIATPGYPGKGFPWTLEGAQPARRVLHFWRGVL